MTRFLRRLRQFWERIFQRASSLPASVQPTERLSRYILGNTLFKRNRTRISPQLFMPSPKTQNTSVYRTQGCPEAEIWNIGDRYVTPLHPEHKPILGRADISAQMVFDSELRVTPHPIPHFRHANIDGWPTELHEQLMKATELAKHAQPVGRPVH